MSAPTIDDGGPAFPPDGQYAHYKGMTLRDWFAGQTLAGLCACSEIALPTLTDYAKAAYAQADAMLAARKEGRQ